MKKLLFVAALVSLSRVSLAQTETTTTSGNWSDPTVWSGTGSAPPAASDAVNVNNPLTIDTNLSPTGTWTFNSNTTDQPGGTAYTFNPNDGTNVVTISSGTTVTFEGGTAGTPNAFGSGTINIYGTLILGYTQLNNSGNLNITVEAGGTLIINGDLTNKNNSGTFTVNGAVIVNGNFNCTTGSVTVSGSGTINTTGSLTSNGGSTIFGQTNDCSTGPCSGTTLACSFDNYLSPTAATVCSGTSTVAFTSNSGSTNMPTSPTYQWQSSTDNVTFTNVGTNSANYTTPTLTQTTYIRLKITSSSPCTSTSAVAPITVLGNGGWLGTTNNWGTASNWCGGSLPTNVTDVVISNGTGIAFMPVIAAGTAAVTRNLTISNTFPASSVTVAASATASLSIFGDFSNNGSFTDNSTAATAGVILSGSSAQTVAGSSQSTFNNLTFANTSGATPAVNFTTNNVVVNSNLTLTSGMINLNGYTLTLGTSAGASGALTYSAQWIYGGNIARWFPTSGFGVGNALGQFPIGTSTNYRPMWFGDAGLSAGGTIKVSHTGIAGATAVSPTFVDNGGTVQIRSNSYWTVTTANGIGTGTFSIRTQATGMGTVASVNDLRQTLVNSICPGSAGANLAPVTNPTVNRTGLTTANLTNNFYWGSVNPAGTTLPIEVISFSAKLKNNGVDLQWETASEVNNDFFTILHSTTGTNFSPIFTVDGNGTTDVVHSYSRTDFKPSLGNNYYQLMQTDFDGNSTTYEPVFVEVLSLDSSPAIYPNPVGKGDVLNVQLPGLTPDASLQMHVFNSQGMIISSAEVDTDQNGVLAISFSPANLVPGLYILVVQGIQCRFIVR